MIGRRTTRRGFTLVEILVVVVILGIAAMVIVPQIGARGDLKVASASRVLMADLIYAQNRSIAQQKMTYVKFTVSGNTWSLQSSMSPETVLTHPITQDNYTEKVGTGGIKGFEDVSIVSASFGSQPTLAFDELGVPYSYDSSTGTSTPLASSGTVMFKSGNFTLTVSVEPDTGAVTVN